MRYNLLIVDDEIYTLEDICACIDREKLPIGEIFTAVNTAKAMHILEEKEIHVILSDIDMPGGNGLDFLRLVRDTHADTPCIFITNYADFSYAQEAIHLRVLDYLLKPVDPDVLNQTLAKALSLAESSLSSPEPMPETQGETAVPSQKDLYIQRAMAYIGDNLLGDVTRESVSSHVHVTPDHLDRLFREQVGMSTFRYIVARKIEHAQDLLSRTNQPICEIATDLGYCNLSNFSLAFRKQTGMTPAEYRKTHLVRPS